MDKYVPPYDITEDMLELTSEITEDLGKFSIVIGRFFKIRIREKKVLTWQYDLV